MLQVQMTGHQTAIDTLRKAAESLITSDGDLLSNPDEIQEAVGQYKNPRNTVVLQVKLSIFDI